MAYKIIDIEGIGEAYVANLQAKMEEVNAEKNLVNRIPSESELQKMIDQAKEMEVTMTY